MRGALKGLSRSMQIEDSGSGAGLSVRRGALCGSALAVALLALLNFMPGIGKASALVTAGTAAEQEGGPAGSDRAETASQAAEQPAPEGILRRWLRWLGWAPEEGKLVWQASGLGNRISAPVLYDDLVFMAGTFIHADSGKPSMSVLSALVQSTGKLRWTQELGAVIPTAPVVFEHRILVADDSGAVLALDGKTSRKLWRVTLPGPIQRAPVIAGKYVAVLAGSTVVALDADTGATRWQRAFPAPTAALGTECEAAVESSNDLVVVYRLGELQVLDSSDGSTRWSQSLPAGCKEPLTVSAGIVIVGDGPTGLRAIRLEDGLERWRFASNIRLQGFRAAQDGVLAVTSPEHRIVAIDLGSGKKLWIREFALPLPPPLLALEQSLVFRSAPDRLTVLVLKSGREAWSSLLPAGLSYLPLASKNGRVFVPLAGGALAAIDGAGAGT